MLEEAEKCSVPLLLALLEAEKYNILLVLTLQEAEKCNAVLFIGRETAQFKPHAKICRLFQITTKKDLIY